MQPTDRATLIALADELELLTNAELSFLRRLSAKEDVLDEWMKASGLLAEKTRSAMPTIIASLRALAGDQTK